MDSGESVDPNSTGKFTLKLGYKYWDPYDDGMSDEFWGYGVGDEDPYVQETFGSVTPEPVCLLGQTMDSFGWAHSVNSGWLGMRVWFSHSDGVSCPPKIKITCHSTGESVVLGQVFNGLYGDPNNYVYYPSGILEAMDKVDAESIWEIDTAENLFLGELSHGEASSKTMEVLRNGVVIYSIDTDMFNAQVGLAIGDIIAPQDKSLYTNFIEGFSSGISVKEVLLDGYSDPVFEITALQDGFRAEFDIMR